MTPNREGHSKEGGLPPSDPEPAGEPNVGNSGAGNTVGGATREG